MFGLGLPVEVSACCRVTRSLQAGAGDAVTPRDPSTFLTVSRQRADELLFLCFFFPLCGQLRLIFREKL